MYNDNDAHKKIKDLIDEWWMQNNSDAHKKDICPNRWMINEQW